MSFIVAQHIEMVARTFPERIAAEVIDGERVTYSELWRRVLRLATALRDVQAGPDGRMVAFLMSNGVEPLVASLACQWSGCASVPVNTRFAQAEILHVLRDSGATLLLSLGDQLERAHAAAAECGIRVLDVAALDAAGDATDGSPPRAADPRDQVAVVFYTSGTTGFPKGAAITHQVWMERLLWWGWEFDIGADDLMLVPGPIFHMSFGSLAICALLRGASVRIQQRFDPAVTFEELAQRCTWSLLIPSMTTLLVERWNDAGRPHLPAARYLLSSGAALSAETLRDMMAMFPNAKIDEAYGWTEGNWVTRETKRADTLVVGCVGWPAFGSGVMVVDEQGSPCPPGIAGEVVARSSAQFSHYLNRPEATQAARRNDGYVKSGDIGTFLPDGRLVILDRRADMIVTGGENVYSAEVERVVALMPAVRECSVVGQPDQRWGSAVTAVVALREGEGASADELKAFCRKHLAGYKCPKRVVFVAQLPRNSMGKVEKFRVRALVTDAQ